ncbi:uncharacterized protein LOC129618213 [Condylostylus longicornis]|uniref:uncharacterized protein LOC129618213 n=1 Tax=Condylostylus longicornis TaxID=2530218 RepID=UPI00244DECCD|nr:uncharacterized protein LOC129618213 [Condylostylus longicornis]
MKPGAKECEIHEKQKPKVVSPKRRKSAFDILEESFSQKSSREENIPPSSDEGTSCQERNGLIEESVLLEDSIIRNERENGKENIAGKDEVQRSDEENKNIVKKREKSSEKKRNRKIEKVINSEEELIKLRKEKTKKRKEFLVSQGLIDEIASEGEEDPEAENEEEKEGKKLKKKKEKIIMASDEEEGLSEDEEMVEDLIATEEAAEEADEIGWSTELFELHRERMSEDEERVYERHFTLAGMQNARQKNKFEEFMEGEKYNEAGATETRRSRAWRC